MSFPANYGLPSIFNVCISLNSLFLKRIEPNKPAYVTEIGNDYESRRNAVGGLIELIPFLHDPHAVMVGNEEAKLLGMEGNRRFMEGSSPNRSSFAAMTAKIFVHLRTSSARNMSNCFHTPTKYRRTKWSMI